MKYPGAELFVPAKRSYTALTTAVQSCRGCDLFANATQAVFGEGGKSPRIVFIGEQPGNDEDLKGHPFVGPAGKLLDKALSEADIERTDVYVTNAVKHFKFEERGKRRIHQKPTIGEVKACRPWLEAEIGLVKPEVIVALGATAAQTVFGKDFRLTEQRGNALEHPWARHALATVHPSAILRAPDSEQRHQEYARFVSDLRVARDLL
jgi:uracil-DNA glycosylase